MKMIGSVRLGLCGFQHWACRLTALVGWRVWPKPMIPTITISSEGVWVGPYLGLDEIESPSLMIIFIIFSYLFNPIFSICKTQEKFKFSEKKMVKR